MLEQLLLLAFPFLGEKVDYFQGNFAEAQEKSRMDKKPILIDFFTEW